MNLFSPSSPIPSSLCTSSKVPSVTVARHWVSPRVKRAEPWVRGSIPTSMEMGLMSSKPLPSSLFPWFTIKSLINFFWIWKKASLVSLISSSFSSGMDSRRLSRIFWASFSLPFLIGVRKASFKEGRISFSIFLYLAWSISSTLNSLFWIWSLS